MNDLIIPLWYILFAIGFPISILLWTNQDNKFGDAVRKGGVATLIIGTLITAVAVPFMSFGRTSYPTTDARGEVISRSEYLRLWDGSIGEALAVTMISFVIPLLLVGLIATKLIVGYPRLGAGLLWALALWMLGWQVTMLSSASAFIGAVPIMAIVTAVFGTLAFREQKQREVRPRQSTPVPG